jgi:hypothetical protein
MVGLWLLVIIVHTRTLVLVWVFCLCPFSVGAVVTFVDVAVFPEQCSALQVSP